MNATSTVTLVAVSLAACSAAAQDRPGEPGRGESAEDRPATREYENAICPTDIEGLEARALAIRGGARLVLTTDDLEDVWELRARLRSLAHVHERRARFEERGVAPPPGEERFQDPDASIHRAEELEVVLVRGGARLDVRTDDPELASELRAELRETAAALERGSCPLSLSLEMG